MLAPNDVIAENMTHGALEKNGLGMVVRPDILLSGIDGESFKSKC
jgi:hypothetical protein